MLLIVARDLEAYHQTLVCSSKITVRERRRKGNSATHFVSPTYNILIEHKPPCPGGIHRLILRHEFTEFSNPGGFIISHSFNFDHLSGLFEKLHKEVSHSAFGVFEFGELIILTIHWHLDRARREEIPKVIVWWGIACKAAFSLA